MYSSDYIKTKKTLHIAIYLATELQSKDICSVTYIHVLPIVCNNY